MSPNCPSCGMEFEKVYELGKTSPVTYIRRCTCPQHTLTEIAFASAARSLKEIEHDLNNDCHCESCWRAETIRKIYKK